APGAMTSASWPLAARYSNTRRTELVTPLTFGRNDSATIATRMRLIISMSYHRGGEPWMALSRTLFNSWIKESEFRLTQSAVTGLTDPSSVVRGARLPTIITLRSVLPHLQRGAPG